MDSTTPSVFLRKASGLVKAASVWDVFIFNTGLISIGIGVLYTHLYGPSSYPGGDIAIASLIATVAMLAVGAGMWSWSVTIPRSGAIYVFLSRTGSPALGFSLGLLDACCWLFYNAVAAVLFSTAGLAPLSFGLYLTTKNPAYLHAAAVLNQPWVSATFGSILILLCGFALLIGMRRFFALQKLMFVVAIVGTLVMLYCLVAFTPADLARNLASVAGGADPYHNTIQAALKAGLHLAPRTFAASIPLAVWPFLPLIGGAFSIAIAGEVRNVVKGQGIGILGSIAVTGILFAVIGHLSYTAFGEQFQAAITFLNLQGLKTGLEGVPYFSTLLAILSNNLALTLVVSLGFIAWIYFWIPGMLAYANRVMLAWSFDRAAPEALGHVNDRYHTPTVATILCVVISIILTWLYACTDFFKTLIFIEAATWAWLVTAIAGILLPYRRPDLWKRSLLGGRTFLGVPLISFLNALSALALIGMGYLLWNDQLAAGHSIQSIATIVGVFAFGLIFFYGMKFYRRKQGIDIDLAYREIPIE